MNTASLLRLGHHSLKVKKNKIFQNETLAEIAKKHNKAVAQVSLHWVCQKGIVALAKTVNRDRMIENINIFEFELDQKDMDMIAGLETRQSSFFDHRDPNMVKWLGERKLNS